MTFAIGPFAGALGQSRGWLRIFGVGVAWKDTRRHPPLFSERYGFTRTVQVGAYSFKALRRNKP